MYQNHFFPFGPNAVARDGGMLFIFEMANNHQGSVKHGLNIIRIMGQIARKRGIAGAIKFQFRQIESFLHPGFVRSQLPGSSNKHVRRFLETSLSYEQYVQMVGEARDKGLVPFATPYDEASVDWCQSLELPVIKIASSSVTDWPLLRRIAQANTPVVFSTGGCSLYDIDNVVAFFQRNKIPLAIMHCVGIYPLTRQHAFIDQVHHLRQRYQDLVIGYSAHETVDDLDIVELAVASGAALLERHVGLPTDTITLNAYSLAPEAVERWVDLALKAHQAMGVSQKHVIPDSEARNLDELRRGVYVRVSKKPGEFYQPEDLMLAMPCLPGQFNAADLDSVIGLPVPRQGIAAMMPVMKDGVREVPLEISASSIVERVKQILEDARIVLPKDIPAELSHPYGLDRFEECGAVIVDIVNREYCKKLIIQLPGQGHPLHKHIQKEETFQVLFGEVEAEVNGQVSLLKPGDSLTIPRGGIHDFRTKIGMIMEEISTTHFKGDSMYEDESIPSDPTTRKTRVLI